MPHATSDSDNDSYSAIDFIELRDEVLPGSSVQSLEDLLAQVDSIFKQADTDRAERCFQVLGTAVGKSKTWQTPFREAGIVAYVIEQLRPDRGPSGLNKQYLRIIGNCVADNDDNRQSVTADLSTIADHIQSDDLRSTVIMVIYNLCNDFEPAKVEAATIRLDSILIQCLTDNLIPDEILDYVAELILWTTGKLSQDALNTDMRSLAAFDNMLEVARAHAHAETEHYQEFAAVCAHYLQDPEFQKRYGTADRLMKVVELIRAYQKCLDSDRSTAVFQALSTAHNPENGPTDHSVLVLTQLINSASAVSATDTFLDSIDDKLSFISDFVSNTGDWQEPQEISPLTVCEYTIVGNLATSDEACIHLVENLRFYVKLNNALSSRNEPAILYAALSCARHLAFPPQNRRPLERTGTMIICCWLLGHQDPAVRGEAAAVIQKLVMNNFDNIKSAVFDEIPDRPGQRHSTLLPALDPPEHPTIFRHIVAQALAPSTPLPSTSMRNATIELPRVIVTMLRHLARHDTGTDVDTVLSEMYKEPRIARPLTGLIKQRFYADARSEGLLGLGLMAHSPEGAARVVDALQADNGVLAAIKEMATDNQKVDPNVPTSGLDLQNAMALLHSLGINGGDAMDEPLKEEVKALQEELSRSLTVQEYH